MVNKTKRQRNELFSSCFEKLTRIVVFLYIIESSINGAIREFLKISISENTENGQQKLIKFSEDSI